MLLTERMTNWPAGDSDIRESSLFQRTQRFNSVLFRDSFLPGDDFDDF